MDESILEALESLKHLLMTLPATLREVLSPKPEIELPASPTHANAQPVNFADLTKQSSILSSAFGHLTGIVKGFKLPALSKAPTPRAHASKGPIASKPATTTAPSVLNPTRLIGSVANALSAKLSAIKLPNLANIGSSITHGITSKLSAIKLPNLANTHGITSKLAAIKLPKLSSKAPGRLVRGAARKITRAARSPLVKRQFPRLAGLSKASALGKRHANSMARTIKKARASTGIQGSALVLPVLGAIAGTLGVLSVVTGGIAVAATAFVAVTNKMQEWRKNALDQNRQNAQRFAMYNGAQFYEQALFQMNEFRRTTKLASGTQQSAVSLTRAANNMQDAWLPFDKLTTNLSNIVATIGANISGAFANIFGPVFSGLDAMLASIADFFGVNVQRPQANNQGDWMTFLRNSNNARPIRRPQDFPPIPNVFLR